MDVGTFPSKLAALSKYSSCRTSTGLLARWDDWGEEKIRKDKLEWRKIFEEDQIEVFFFARK